MTTALDPRNGTPVLPQLRPKRPSLARGILLPPRATSPVSQRTRVRTAAASFPVARLIETILYFWTVVAILLGIVFACFVLFLLFFKEGGNLTSILPFDLAAYGSLAITVASCCGLYGLVYHKQCVMAGRRNYALGTFIVLGVIGAIIVILAGAMALSLVRVVALAQDNEFSSDRVLALETHVISKLHAQAATNTVAWRSTQNALKCCGYDQVSVLRGYLSAQLAWDPALQTAVDDVNAIGGKYCSSRLAECEETVSEAHCPVSGRQWCRTELLRVAGDNYALLGICGLTFGAVQVLCSTLGLFTLLCDVRRLSGLSPMYRIEHQTLSPIQIAEARETS